MFNTEEGRKLVSNFSSLSFLQIFSYVLPLITLPYLVRVLGIEKFGLVMFAQAFIAFLSILVDYGFDLSATREISIHRHNKKKITEIFSSIMILKSGLILVSFLVLNVVIFSFEQFSNDPKLYYATFLIIVGQAMFPVWYFQGLESMKYVAIINIVSKTIFAVLIFVVIQEPEDYIYVPIFNGLGAIVGGSLSLYILYQKFEQTFYFAKYRVLKRYLIDSSGFFLSRASVTVYTSLNVLVLGLLTNSTMVGYYSIAEKLYQALQGLYHPLVLTIYPYFSHNQNIDLFVKLFSYIVLIHLALFGVVFYLSNDIISLLFQLTNREIVQVFYLLLISSIFHVPSMFLGYPFLAAFGFPKHANIAVVYGGLFHVILLSFLILIPSDYPSIYSVSGAVIATELFILVLRIIYIRQENLFQMRKEF